MKYLFYILILLSTEVFGQDLESLSRSILEDFKETFENEGFKIGNIAINEKEEYVFFEIEIIPVNEGVHLVKQIFEYKNDWGYKSNIILNVIKVGNKDSMRIFFEKEPYPYGYTCSVGDTIVIPIMWNKYIENNKFTNGDESDRENYGKIDTFYTSPLINFERKFDWEITNNVDELKVKDIVSEYIGFRHPQSEAVNHIIQFKAVKEGAFNLVIGSYRLPIIIHPQNTSIRKKVTLVMGQQWENSTTASFSLPHGYNATNENMKAILRVGDIIHCTFMEYAQNKQDPLKIELVIEINKEKLQ